MKDWWKAPVLQGPENDYGDYDYLIEEIPKDYAKWELSKYRWKCDECGGESHLLYRTAHYFHTLDGWDSMEYSYCWKCHIKNRIASFKYKIKRGVKIRVNAFKSARQLYKGCGKTKSFKHWYDLMMSVERK